MINEQNKRDEHIETYMNYLYLNVRSGMPMRGRLGLLLVEVCTAVYIALQSASKKITPSLRSKCPKLLISMYTQDAEILEHIQTWEMEEDDYKTLCAIVSVADSEQGDQLVRNCIYITDYLMIQFTRTLDIYFLFKMDVKIINAQFPPDALKYDPVLSDIFENMNVKIRPKKVIKNKLFRRVKTYIHNIHGKEISKKGLQLLMTHLD